MIQRKILIKLYMRADWWLFSLFWANWFVVWHRVEVAFPRILEKFKKSTPDLPSVFSRFVRVWFLFVFRPEKFTRRPEICVEWENMLINKEPVLKNFNFFCGLKTKRNVGKFIVKNYFLLLIITIYHHLL